MKHRHPFRDAGLLAVVGAVPLLICLFVLPGDRSKALDVYLLFLGAVLLLALGADDLAREGTQDHPAEEREDRHAAARAGADRA